MSNDNIKKLVNILDESNSIIGGASVPIKINVLGDNGDILGQDIPMNVIASDGTSFKIKDAYKDVEAEVGLMGDLKVAPSIRLVGAIPSGTTVDPNFWATTTTNGGATTQALGQWTLSTNTSANGATTIQSVRSARYIASNCNYYRCQIRMVDDATSTNIRRWGAFDANNGVFFEYNTLDGDDLRIVTRKSGVDTKVKSSNFNGGAGDVLQDNKIHTCEIYYTNKKVLFCIDDVVKHTVTGDTAPYIDAITLPIRAENTNSGGSTTNIQMQIRSQSICRIGQLETESMYGRITTAATTVFKYGAGRFKKITLNNPVGTLISIYDNTAGSGNTIAIINTPSQANPVTLHYDVPFSNGLTVVSTGTWDATIVYE
jgi:hypothetical protein